MTKKHVLRKKIKKALGEIQLSAQEHWSLAMTRHLLSLPAFQKAQTLGLYSSLEREPSTQGIDAEARSCGKIVAFPLLLQTSDQLAFFAVENPSMQLVPGAYGVREPQPDHCVEVALSSLDLLLIPGVGFDRTGVRLGQGGGHYDRLLARLPSHCLRVGLFFACQEVESLPFELYDEKLDLIITEHEVIEVSSSSFS